MAYRILSDGTIEADTAQEALELQAQLAQRASAGAHAAGAVASDSRMRTGALAPPEGSKRVSARVSASITLEFIDHIVRAGELGIASEDLAKRLSLDSAKGIGPIARRARQTIARASDDATAERVLYRKRARGVVRWYAKGGEIKRLKLT